jgi:hypothetical protein
MSWYKQLKAHLKLQEATNKDNPCDDLAEGVEKDECIKDIKDSQLSEVESDKVKDTIDISSK